MNIMCMIELCSLSASVLDRKIYVAGRYKDGDSSSKNSFNVFDTKTQNWDHVPIPCSQTNGYPYGKTACIDGKVHLASWLGKAVAYNSKESRWDLGERHMRWFITSDYYCEIENVLYAAYGGVIKWYDTKLCMWRILEGLVGLPKLPWVPCSQRRRIQLADYGGKMAVLWDDVLSDCIGFSAKKRIWCAEIALERRNSCEIWGKVEWFDHVLTLPFSFYVVEVLAATV